MALRHIYPKRMVDRFFNVLDGEGVVFFQTLVYVHLAIGGAYCEYVVGGVPESIAKVLGPEFDVALLWLCMGMLICLGGKLLTTWGPRIWARTMGLYFQLAGDLSALGAFAGYVVSTVQGNTGKPLLAVWAFAALAECAFFLCWRDLRRIQQAERRMRR